MKRVFVVTQTFQKAWDKMGLGDSELQYIEKILLSNPKQGSVIIGTGGARKLRIEIKNNKGKSGGGRVIYVDIYEKERIYFLFAYPKSFQDNLSDKQKKQISTVIDAIKKGE